MRLKTLELNNLFSFDSVVIDYFNRGLLLVSGFSHDEKDSNGSGKSSISTNGLTWVMYGKVPSDESRINADDVINRHTGRKTGWGSLSFVSHDGNEYTIVRQRNPNKLELLLDGNNLAAREMTVTQDMIDRLLGKDLQAFLQTDFFGQGRKMSYLSLSPADRRSTLESLLPYESLEPIQELTKTAHGIVKARLVAKTKEHDVLVGKAQAMKIAVKNLETAMNNWAADWHTKMRELEDRIKSHKVIDLTVARENLEKYKAQLPYLKETATTLEYKYIDAKNILTREVNKIEKLETELRKLREARNNCPTCGQALGALAVHHKEEEAKHLEEQLATIQTTYMYTMQERFSAEGKWSEAVTELQECQERIDHVTDIIVKNSNQVQVSELKNQRDILAKEVNPHTDLHYNTIKEEADIIIQGANVTCELDDLKQEELNLGFWASAFSKDLKTALLGAICPYLEARTSHHLAKLNNPQLHVEFSTIKYLSTGEVKEEFSVRTTSDTGSGTYALLSGGEKQLVNFAVGLALADIANLRVKNTSSLLILDEPFVQLGPNNSQSVINYLNELTKTKETILLISNELALQSLVPNKIHVTKSGGISTLEGV